METQSIRSLVEKHKEEKFSIPPGFESLTSFTLKRAEITEDSGPMGIESSCDLEISSLPTDLDLDDSAIVKRTLKFERRPWIVYDQLRTEGDSDSKQHDLSPSPKGCLPKGVIRGCSECCDCQKVTARWDPEGAHSYMLDEAPVFHPSEEEFKDTIRYIDSICQQVEPYGLCRIVPPTSWQLPCFLEGTDIWQSYKFPTQVQRINELQNPCSYKKASPAHDTREVKRRKLDYEFGDGCAANFSSVECNGEESFRSASGPQFSLIGFKRYADYFKKCYFSGDVSGANAKISQALSSEQREPSEENVEGEYWRVVEKPTEEIEVLYGTDLDYRSFDSGFQVSSKPEQVSDSLQNSTSGWNLNHIARLPDSLLSFETDTSCGLLSPKLHVGMCFTSLPWTVEEHHLYRLYYLHLGAPKIWYGTSGHDFPKFEAVTKKHFPSENCPGLHRKLHRQLSPATLKSEDIPVYHCIQRPREFVLFLPGACRSGFDSGFNCSTSAVFAPLNWLPHGQNSIELYREQRRKTSLSHDKVLLRAANETVKAQWGFLLEGKKTRQIMIWKEASGKDGILAKALRARIRSEARCREYLSSAPQSRKMDKSFDAGDPKRECSTCYYDLYLSAATCSCNPSKYSCLKHTKHLCTCPWSNKTFLFRYQISELNLLAGAVEGRLTAIRRWVKEDLGLALQSDSPSEGQYGLVVNPSSVAEPPNGEVTLSGKGKSSSSKSPSESKDFVVGEVFEGKSKGKEIAVSSLSDDTSSSSSSSSSESDIEAYIAHLKSPFMGKKP